MANRGILSSSASAGLMMLMAGFSLSAALAVQGQRLPAGSVVPDGYRQVAGEYGVPAEALYSVSLAESSRHLPQGERPWPWALNVAGKGYRYTTQEEAYQALLGFMRRYPLRRIDVGIAQVNLGWNGRYFRNYREALEPYTNLRAAAQILRHCYDLNPGSWLQAAGCYHHPAGGKPARSYRAIVQRKLATITPAGAHPLSTVYSSPSSVPVIPAETALRWAEPQIPGEQ
ncbi:TPA: lytic transglycosylase domain-containing protein [Salmonella enterica]|nr:lytic transglycosylase domain-containing protein [Salmonella enterica subsp. enterica serovar Newport]EDU7786957.1 lytic transglycosylase domain-containing protein [Salmonella enterica subsp. enterica serovar Oranienburg]HAK8204856.1 lytic transglycosylase domain-containing protein [Salmonella enterica]